jgi:hypothetical protein
VKKIRKINGRGDLRLLRPEGLHLAVKTREIKRPATSRGGHLLMGALMGTSVNQLKFIALEING